MTLVIVSLELGTNASSTNSPSKGLKKALVSELSKEGYSYSDPNDEMRLQPFSFTEIDLNGDGKKETISIFRKRLLCSNRSCRGYIFTSDRNHTDYEMVSDFMSSRGGLNVAVLKSRSHGWLDLATPIFHYEEPRGVDWIVWKFNGKIYERTDKLKTIPKRIVLSENYPEFQLDPIKK